MGERTGEEQVHGPSGEIKSCFRYIKCKCMLDF